MCVCTCVVHVQAYSPGHIDQRRALKSQFSPLPLCGLQISNWLPGVCSWDPHARSRLVALPPAWRDGCFLLKLESSYQYFVQEPCLIPVVPFKAHLFIYIFLQFHNVSLEGKTFFPSFSFLFCTFTLRSFLVFSAHVLSYFFF